MDILAPFRKLWKPQEQKNHQSDYRVNTVLRSMIEADKAPLVHDGYILNAVVYRCISEITKAASDIKIDYCIGDKTLDNNESSLIYQAFSSSSRDFIEQCLINWLSTGVVYIESQDNELKVLASQYVHRSYSMLNNERHITEYIYNYDGIMRTFPYVPSLAGPENLLVVQFYNPYKPLEPHSPLEAAGYAIDIQNKGMRWNSSALDNNCVPSGLYKTEQSLSQETLTSLTEQLRAMSAGVNNARRSPVLEGGLEYQQMGMSAVDMDYINSIDKATEHVAMALGIPLPLVQTDASTFNNLSSARELFYETTVIPLLSRLLKELSIFIDPKGKHTAKPNLDSISALEDKRKRKFDTMLAGIQGGVITPNEARVELGWDEIPDASMNEYYLPGGLVPMADIDDEKIAQTIQDMGINNAGS